MNERNAHRPDYIDLVDRNYCVLIRSVWLSQALTKPSKLDPRDSNHHISAALIQNLMIFENMKFKCRFWIRVNSNLDVVVCWALEFNPTHILLSWLYEKTIDFELAIITFTLRHENDAHSLRNINVFVDNTNSGAINGEKPRKWMFNFRITFSANVSLQLIDFSWSDNRTVHWI